MTSQTWKKSSAAERLHRDARMATAFLQVHEMRATPTRNNAELQAA